MEERSQVWWKCGWNAMLVDPWKIACESERSAKEEQRADLESNAVCLDQWSHPRGRRMGLEEREHKDSIDSGDLQCDSLGVRVPSLVRKLIQQLR